MNFEYEENRIYLNNGQGLMIAEVTFPAVSEHVVNINHTFVDPSLRGQGVADKLLRHAADLIREQNKKAILTCSYAIVWFERHPEYKDLIAEQ